MRTARRHPWGHPRATVRQAWPRDVAFLFDRPSTISEGRGVDVTSEALPIEALQAIIEHTRGLVEPAPQESPIPRAPRRLDD